MVAEFDTWLKEQEDHQKRCKALAEVKEDGTQQLEELLSERRSRHRIGSQLVVVVYTVALAHLRVSLCCMALLGK
eukprot:5303269-Amphidinium_carterae.1